MHVYKYVSYSVYTIFHIIGNPATSITHTNLPHNILKSHIPYLCGVIANPDKLGNDLSLVELIPDIVEDMQLTRGRYQKASTLFNAMHHYLEECSDPQILKSFCYILKEQDDSALDEIADDMLKQFGKYRY